MESNYFIRRSGNKAVAVIKKEYSKDEAEYMDETIRRDKPKRGSLRRRIL